MTLAFTGHRPEGLPFKVGSKEYEDFQFALWQEISARIDAGYDTFYCEAERLSSLSRTKTPPTVIL